MKKIRLMIIGVLLIAFSGCIFVPVDEDHRERHEAHDRGGHRGGGHSDGGEHEDHR